MANTNREIVDELKAEFIPAFVQALKQIQAQPREGELSDRELVELSRDFSHAKAEIESLKKQVYDKHDPVINWTRDFIDSYRKVITAVIISGLVTGIGIVIQLYTLVGKK